MAQEKEIWTRFYQLVGQDVQIKSFHQIVQYLLQFASLPTISSKDLAKGIIMDPAISTKVLAVVNSPAMGLRYQVKDLAYAVSLLGHQQIRDIMLGIAIFNFSGKEEKQMVRIWKHSFYCAQISEILARAAGRLQAEAFTAGLLHDLGKVILESNNPSAFQTALKNWEYHRGKLQYWESEKEILGMTHSEIGAMAGMLWKLPEEICYSILAHHAPKTGILKTEAEYLGQTAHIADLLCWVLNRSSLIGPNPFSLRKPETCLPDELLSPLGLNQQIYQEILPEIKEKISKSETIFEWIKIQKENFAKSAG